MWLALTYSASLYGPLPTACVARVSRLALFSQAGAGMAKWTSLSGRIGSGVAVVRIW